MLIFVLLATIFTANDLKQQCSSKEPLKQIWCLGYLKGVSDGVMFATAVSPRALQAEVSGRAAEAEMISSRDLHAALGCVSEEVTMEQIRLVFLKYVENHPEELHLPAAE